MGVFIAIAVCAACYFAGRALQWLSDARRAMGSAPTQGKGARGRR